MKATFRITWGAIGLILTASMLIGCGLGKSAQPTATLMGIDAINTAAAKTADARLTAKPTNTPLPVTPTATPNLTQTAAVAGTAAALALTPSPAPTLANTLPPTASSTPSGGIDSATYVKDVNIPDGTQFAAGASFKKTWQFMNGGSSNWTTAYQLVFVSGDPIGGPVSVALPMDVPSGQLVDISVNLVAPQTAASYKGFWRLRNANGQYFGDAVYVQISVGASGTASASTTPGTPTITFTPNPLATNTITPTPTVTATGSGPIVSDAAISVDNATVSGACPHKYVFTASFKLNQAATVTYQLEAGGFSLTLPAPATDTLSAGTYTLTYELEIAATGTGWARLHVTAPLDVASSQVALSLTCQP
jgi:hypothetical protein